MGESRGVQLAVLHGQPGLGNATCFIVDYMRRNQTTLVVHYTTAERFRSEFVELPRDRMKRLR